jgi:hypothetical protein
MARFVVESSQTTRNPSHEHMTSTQYRQKSVRQTVNTPDPARPHIITKQSKAASTEKKINL